MVRPLPLALRVPNPPPVFIGRVAEAERLAELIRRSPLALVHGPDSAGKLALVLHVLHRRFKSRVDRTLYVRGADDEPIERTIARALAQVHGLDAVPTDDLAEVALDLAEAASAWLVIDGVHEPAGSFAALAARYARNAHWILIGRHPPAAEVLEHAVHIGPLGEPELAQLASAWHPELAAHEAALAAAAAQGSPWRLRRVLADRISGGPASLVVVEAAAERILDQLASVHEPVPAELLDVPTPMIEALVERGLVGFDGIRVTLHPAARALRTAPRRGDAELATRLAATHEPALVAEAIAMAVLLERFDLARAWLDADGARLVSAGLAARVARSIPPDPGELRRWALRLFVELGDGDRLRALTPGPDDQLLWAEGLLRAGHADEALAAARQIDDPAARILVARILGTGGDFEAALDVLAHVSSPDATALAARVAALANRAPAARAELAKLRDVTARTTELLYTIASAHHELGDLAATEQILDAIDARLASDPLARFAGRRSKLLRAAVRLDRGQLDSAAELLADVERASSRASVHRPFLALLAAQHALATGDGARALAELRALPPALGAGYLGAWRAAIDARARLLAPGAPEGAHEDHTGLWPAIARIHRARVMLRLGTHVDVPAVDDDAAFELWIAAQALAWERALVAGDAASAHAIATAAAARAGVRGFACWAAEARCGIDDAAVLAGTPHPDVSPAELERRARRADPAGRRARWLLGHPQEADAIDTRVCVALGTPPAQILAGARPDYAAGWGIDRRTRSAWLPDGRVVELADSPQLWRLVDTLCAAPAGIAKEALVTQTWEVAYHPLRHDKRLHNAIHKLRKLLEDDPALPRRIPTTADGYRLGDDEPMRRFG